MNEQLSRFSITLSKSLLEKFDELIKKKEFVNRSEAIRNLIRDYLISESWKYEDKLTFGTILIIYDHHKKRTLNSLLDIQHEYLNSIISSMHIHIDQSNCLEIIIVKDKAEKMKNLADNLKAIPNVKLVKLSLISIEDIY